MNNFNASRGAESYDNEALAADAMQRQAERQRRGCV